jgi:signal transduction histidine kinase
MAAPTLEAASVIAVSEDLARVSHTLQVSAAPVFMLAAITSLLLVLNNRLQYIGERLKLMEQELANVLQQDPHLDTVIDKFQGLRKLLRKRINLIRNAMAFASTSGLLIALDVGTLFLGALTQYKVSVFVAATFMLAMLCFQVSLLYFLRELLGKHCIADFGPLIKHHEL